MCVVFVCTEGRVTYGSPQTWLSEPFFITIKLASVLFPSLSTPHNPFYQASISSASQEFPCILWKPKVHYRFHMRLLLISILNQINPVQAPILFLEITFKILPSLPRSSN
jgi:hypothetical protein